MRQFKLTILFLFLSLSGLCCDCEPISIAQGYYYFDFIAIGKVGRVYNQTKDSYFIDFKIENLIKGDNISTLEVYSTPENYFTIQNSDTLFYFTSCDMYLREGEQWILFASKDNSGVYGLDYCSPSQKMTEIADHERQIIKELDSIENYIFPSYELDTPNFLTQKRAVLDTLFVKNTKFNTVTNLTVQIDENGKLIKATENSLTEFQKIGFDYLIKLEPFEPGKINGKKVKSEYYLKLKRKK